MKATLDSVLNQTYSNWECIIVDDHSTDASWEIIEEYGEKDKRFKIYKRPENRKKGANSARNYAIEISKGEYIAFLDSDDIWKPTRLEKVLGFINNGNHYCIFSGALIHKINSSKKISSRDIKPNESAFDFILSDDVFCQTSSLVIHYTIVNKVNFDEEMMRHQDYDFFIRVNEVYPWKYFENYDVIVNWTRDNIQKINYYNCIPFYVKHWKKSKNKKIRYKYIIRITSSSVRGNFKYNLASYYRNVLKNEGYQFSFKEYILFYTPFVFSLLSKFKWFIKGFF